jgi:hypothetical protein
MAMGRPKAKLVLSAGQREQLESSSQLALPAGRVGDAGANHSAECGGKNQSADRPPSAVYR